MAQAKPLFDPITVVQTLDQHGVTYIIIGPLGRVIHGTGELTSGIDIVPAMAEKNLRRLRLALEDLHARRPDGNLSDFETDLRDQPLLELQTDAGEVKIVAEPAGTRGYRTLRSRANRESLGHGVRPSVAAIDDHEIMLAVLNREQDLEALRTLSRLIELDYQRRRVPKTQRR
jgi:hypothetical protein